MGLLSVNSAGVDHQLTLDLKKLASDDVCIGSST